MSPEDIERLRLEVELEASVLEQNQPIAACKVEVKR